VVITTSFYSSTLLQTVQDNLSGTYLTSLTASTGSSSDAQIWYELLPSSTGSATLTLSAFNTFYGGETCVIPITGITGVYDSNVSNSSGTTSCAAGSITPGSGSHMVVAGVSASNTGTMTLSSPYTLVGQSALNSGVSFGGGGGYYATGSATNPTWGNTTNYATCTIASFH
jgi:hypothetical protein